MIRKFIYCQTLLVVIVLGGCKEAAKPASAPPRPVSYVELEISNPSQATRLTGSIESWKREDIGFEVAGRVLRVVEPGTNMLGRTYDEEGNLLSEGTILAEIDSERYEIASKQAQAAADAARADLEEVIPGLRAEAQAALDFANTELERYTRLVEKQSAPQQRLDVAKTAQQAATAKVAQVEALRATKVGLLNSSLAASEQAKVSIADCKLYSPFTGQVARVHVLPGGYALPGQAVVTVQMMDPMKVNIAVSAETDQRINQNDLVRVYASDGKQFEGKVYLKDTFADPATRTFLVTLLVRNQRELVGLSPEAQKNGTAQCRDIWNLEQPNVGSDENFYAEVGAIHEDTEGHFVWKVENLTRERLFEDFDPELRVKKVRVTIGDGRFPVLQVFTFRELTDIGELDPKTDVIVGDISGEVGDDGQMVLVRERWLGRPGDVVRVGLKGKETPAGFYIPEDAIQFDGTAYHVAVAEEESDGTEQVNFIDVSPGEAVSSFRRIEGELEPGMKVIVDGAHFVNEGEKVRSIDRIVGSDSSSPARGN